MCVYRYMPFKYFMDMVKSRTLRFVNPLTEWSDDKEGFLFKMARLTPEDVKNEIPPKKLDSILFDQIYNGGLDKNSTRDDDWFAMRCQSWSKDRNSAKMWQEYSNDNKSVCLKVALSSLNNLHYNGKKVETIEVKYKKNLVVKDEIRRILGNRNEIWFPLMFEPKSSYYAFENEYRLYIAMLNKDGHKQVINNVIYVPINVPINMFILEVLPDPSMSVDDSNLIIEFCNKYDLKFSQNEKAVDYSE